MSKEPPQRRLRWLLPEGATPQHPYRDTLIAYGALALLIVLFAWITGGDIGHAVIIAVAMFVAAVAWSSVSWRRRLRREAAERADPMEES